MNLNLALKSDRLCKATTGMAIQEFKTLATQFEWNYLEFKKEERKNREKQRIKKGLGKFKRQNVTGRPNGFKNAQEMLFAALIYLKTYPTFDLMEVLLKVPRSTCHRNVPDFFKVLEKTLGRHLVLPKRRIGSIEEFLQAFPEIKEYPEISIDGTERPVARSKNSKTQNKRYSGKKKTHTKKHMIVTDKTKKIRILTKARNGRRHKKKITDKDGLYDFIPPEVITYQDTGLQGVQHKHKNSMISHKKKPKSKHNPSPPPLTQDQKEENQIISSIRVGVEHVIWFGLKRFNSMSHRFRNKSDELADRMTLLTTGLWNYQLLLR
jgi:hypothetical protein